MSNKIFRVPYGNIEGKKKPYILLLTITILLLAGIGLLNLYSATTGSYIFKSQLRNSLIALIAFVAFGWFVPVRWFQDYAYTIYGTMITLLLSVLAFGTVLNGSKRWLSLGPLSGQPSELAKLAIIIIVAKYLTSHKSHLDYTLKELVPLSLFVIGIFGLILIQPDLGTAGLCLMIAAAMTFFVPIHRRTVAFLSSLGIASFIIGWNFILRDYQRLRILNFLNPNLDPHGSGYNIQQSLIAIGSGGLFGKGYLKGTQTQLDFLPARHSDFVLSVFSEENGFFITLGVFALYSLLFYLALEIARSTKDRFNCLLAVGIAAKLFLQFTINVAMVLGVFPVVGMPLPFLSFGGTSLIVCAICVGILISIHRFHENAEDNNLGMNIAPIQMNLKQ